MSVTVMLGRNPENEREDNESDRALFFPGEHQDPKPLAELHRA